VSRQTVKPDEVIVISTGFDWNQKMGKTKKLNYVLYNLPSRKLAGWARNKGALISTGEVIVFCDVDDKIHPQKCEYMKRVFQNPEVSAVVTNYYSPKDFDGWQDLNFEYEEILEHDNCLIAPNRADVCHGHLSCRTDIFLIDKIWYDEDKKRGQDTKFCNRICDHPDHKIFYTPQKLLVYYPSQTRRRR
tara:strand:- start:1723 stop:2289 length:567 start_codon:yes stop_codon:yes gene_type:complete